MRALGWTLKEAVGKHIPWGDGEKTVVGVMMDFHMHSMHLPIQPLMMLLGTRWFEYLSVRVRPGDLPGAIASLERTMQQFSPYPFEYQFLDENFDALYKADLRLGETSALFTVLALLIASLGLFGLAAFAAQQRTKEMGIRKVFGASAGTVVMLLTRDFYRLVVVAAVMAVPIAYAVMHHWLEGFAYHVDLGPGMTMLTGGPMSTLVLLAVCYQAIRAALANPVESLRHE